jgi:hypothetical protein
MWQEFDPDSWANESLSVFFSCSTVYKSSDTLQDNFITRLYKKEKRMAQKIVTTRLPAAEASLGGLPSHNCNNLLNVHQMASQSMIQQCLESPHPLNEFGHLSRSPLY